jgi:energy-coupling factor transporter ATP-binding protein EcfA2
MLKTMRVKNFTVFKDEVFEFSPGVNIVIGENGVGKTHLLKLAYAMMSSNAELGIEAKLDGTVDDYPVLRCVKKLLAVFRVKISTDVVRRSCAEINGAFSLEFASPSSNFGIGFEVKNTKEMAWTLHSPAHWLTIKPVFLPTHELLTIYKGFVSLYNGRFLSFEETWRDTCDLLGIPLLKGAGAQNVTGLLAPIEAAIGGKVVLDESGEFYLDIPGSGRMEMHMVAEGYRKLAMLAHLIANGMIAEQGYLFWDEPESNLNAKLIRVVAEVIVELARHGVQVFIATHSLFLMRELEILLADKAKPVVPARYIGLSRGENGVEVSQGEQSADLAEIVALDESLKQSDRYLAMEY